MENCSYRCRNVTAVVPNDCLWSCPSLPAMRCSLRRRSAPCLPPGTRFLVCTLVPADCSQVVQPYVLVPVVGGGGLCRRRPEWKITLRETACPRPSSRAQERTEPAPLPRTQTLMAFTHLLHFTQLSPRRRRTKHEAPRITARRGFHLESRTRRGARRAAFFRGLVIYNSNTRECWKGWWEAFLSPPPPPIFPQSAHGVGEPRQRPRHCVCSLTERSPGPSRGRAQITPSWNSTGRSTQLSVHRDHRSPRLQSTLTLHRVNDLQWKIRNRKSNAIESVIGHVTVDIWPSYSGNMHRESVFSK